MTKHPWLFEYQIQKDSKYLIIGTHPPMPYCGKLEFYYGNLSEFWRFLQDVYPHVNLYHNGCPSINNILSFLKKYNIWISDIVEETDGRPFSSDMFMKPVKLNSKLKNWIEQSNVDTIYLTSFGGSKSTLSLFKKWVKEYYPNSKTIPNHKQWIENGVEINLGDKVYLLELLYSPSPQARRGIQRSVPFINWKLKNNNNSIDDFRAAWYKMKLPKINALVKPN